MTVLTEVKENCLGAPCSSQRFAGVRRGLLRNFVLLSLTPGFCFRAGLLRKLSFSLFALDLVVLASGMGLSVVALDFS